MEASRGAVAWGLRTERQDLHDALDERYPRFEDFREFAKEGEVSKTSDPGYREPSVTAEPAQHIPCSTEGLPDKPVFCSTCGYTPHGCEACLRRLVDKTPPNHFDPREALDTILRLTRGAGMPSRGATTKRTILWDNLAEIQNQVHLLRAYTTGMER